MVHLSIITPTFKRGTHIANCLAMVRNQSYSGIELEHIVVSDAPDPFCQRLCGYFGARYFDTQGPHGDGGATARAFGCLQARGEYLAFWDDDNYYPPFAAAAILSNVWGHDVGIHSIAHHETGISCPLPQKLPWMPPAHERLNPIDTQCLCVSRRVSEVVRWDSDPKIGNDRAYINEVFEKFPDATVAYTPVQVCIHVPARLG